MVCIGVVLNIKFYENDRLDIDMNYNEELVAAFMEAVSNAFLSLKKTHNEHFYYYVFIFDAGLHPYLSAWSYKALEKSMVDNKITDEEKRNIEIKLQAKPNPFALKLPVKRRKKNG